MDFQEQIKQFRRTYEAITEQVGRVIVGQEESVHQVLTCLLAGGHALVEGVPGIGKTLLVRTLAQALELTFSRIQFTPDLMPSDITGSDILAAGPDGAKAFRFQPGPIFAHLVLADEINRATPKTQSAVLEAMQERTVSVAQTTHELPDPFVVLATQNPIEMEGTYPLPEAQLDRFLLKILISPPAEAETVRILERTTDVEIPQARAVADASTVRQMKRSVRQVTAASHVMEYVARLVTASHPENPESPAMVRRYVRYGASPRGAQAILLAAKVSALRAGRANVAFEDAAQAARPALRHRLLLNFEAHAEGISGDRVVEEILQMVSKTQ